MRRYASLVLVGRHQVILRTPQQLWDIHMLPTPNTTKHNYTPSGIRMHRPPVYKTTNPKIRSRIPLGITTCTTISAKHNNRDAFRLHLSEGGSPLKETPDPTRKLLNTARSQPFFLLPIPPHLVEQYRIGTLELPSITKVTQDLIDGLVGNNNTQVDDT